METFGTSTKSLLMKTCRKKAVYHFVLFTCNLTNVNIFHLPHILSALPLTVSDKNTHVPSVEYPLEAPTCYLVGICRMFSWPHAMKDTGREYLVYQNG